jgi:serine/threonine protein kinase
MTWPSAGGPGSSLQSGWQEHRQWCGSARVLLPLPLLFAAAVTLWAGMAHACVSKAEPLPTSVASILSAPSAAGLEFAQDSLPEGMAWEFTEQFDAIADAVVAVWAEGFVSEDKWLSAATLREYLCVGREQRATWKRVQRMSYVLANGTLATDRLLIPACCASTFNLCLRFDSPYLFRRVHIGDANATTSNSTGTSTGTSSAATLPLLLFEGLPRPVVLSNVGIANDTLSWHRSTSSYVTTDVTLRHDISVALLSEPYSVLPDLTKLCSMDGFQHSLKPLANLAQQAAANATSHVLQHIETLLPYSFYCVCLHRIGYNINESHFLIYRSAERVFTDLPVEVDYLLSSSSVVLRIAQARPWPGNITGVYMHAVDRAGRVHFNVVNPISRSAAELVSVDSDRPLLLTRFLNLPSFCCFNITVRLATVAGLGVPIHAYKCSTDGIPLPPFNVRVLDHLTNPDVLVQIEWEVSSLPGGNITRFEVVGHADERSGDLGRVLFVLTSDNNSESRLLPQTFVSPFPLEDSGYSEHSLDEEGSGEDGDSHSHSIGDSNSSMNAATPSAAIANFIIQVMPLGGRMFDISLPRATYVAAGNIRVRAASRVGYSVLSAPATELLSSPAADSSGRIHRNFKSGLVIGVSVAALLLLLGLITMAYLAYRNRRAVDYFVFPLPDKWEVTRSDLVIEEAIGAGAFGVVNKGFLKPSARIAATITVAVKRGTNNLTPKEKAEFVAEAQMMKAVSDPPHPNVIQLLAVCMQSEPLLICLEFAPNGNLKNYVRLHKKSSKHPLTQDHLTTFALEAVRGMNHLVSLGIVHRDLACRNLLVADPPCVKIADFGLSRNVQMLTYYRTTTDESVLPVRWLAPENISSGVFSHEGDVYAFGVTMWEMFSYGQLPYPNKNNQEVSELICDGVVNEAPADCPEHIYELMQQCWVAQDQRPTFVQLEATLSRLVRDHPSPSRMPSVKSFDMASTPSVVRPRSKHSHSPPDVMSCPSLMTQQSPVSLADSLLLNSEQNYNALRRKGQTPHRIGASSSCECLQLQVLDSRSLSNDSTVSQESMASLLPGYTPQSTHPHLHSHRRLPLPLPPPPLPLPHLGCHGFQDGTECDEYVSIVGGDGHDCIGGTGQQRGERIRTALQFSLAFESPDYSPVRLSGNGGRSHGRSLSLVGGGSKSLDLDSLSEGEDEHLGCGRGEDDALSRIDRASSSDSLRPSTASDESNDTPTTQQRLSSLRRAQLMLASLDPSTITETSDSTPRSLSPSALCGLAEPGHVCGLAELDGVRTTSC